MAGKNAWRDSQSFGHVFYGCLSMGLLYCWINLNGAVEGTAFGSPLGDSLYTLPVHSILFRAAIGLGFVAISWLHGIFADERRAALLSGVLGAAGTLLCWCSTLVGPAGFVLGNILSGAAAALFMSLWLARYRQNTEGLFVLLLLTSIVSGLFLPCIAYFGGAFPQAASLLLPLAAVGVFLYAPCRGTLPQPAGSEDSRPAIIHGILQAIVLLLCNFASGPATYGMIAATGNEPQVARAISLILVAVLGFGKGIRNEILIAIAALAVCLCIAPALVFENIPSWLSPLASAAFWVITKYSIAWFAVNGSSAHQGLSSVSLRGLGAIYLFTALAEVVGMLVARPAACAIALVTVGFALAIALIDATRSSGTHPAVALVPSETSTPVAAPTRPSALDDLAQQAALTESERNVFEYLSRGYSLKEIARQLNLTEGGAKYHRHNVYQKLGVTSRQELITLVESHDPCASSTAQQHDN